MLKDLTGDKNLQITVKPFLSMPVVRDKIHSIKKVKKVTSTHIGTS